jgi:hypothetical protein
MKVVIVPVKKRGGFGGSFPMNADVDSAIAECPAFRVGLEKLAKKLYAQMQHKRSHGRIVAGREEPGLPVVGINFSSVTFSLVFGEPEEKP